jgi:soluble lytic murein transglycosylase
METWLMMDTLKHNLTITRYLSFAKVLLTGLTLILPIGATSHELSRCGRALHQAIQGTFEGSLRPQSCPVTSRLVQWLQLQKPEEMILMPFSKTMAFFHKNPGWPFKDRIQARAEENLKDDENLSALRKYFDENPPLTARGATFYARALIQIGRKNAAVSAIRHAWVTFDFEGAALKPFWQEFKGYLTQDDHQRRVDRLLMREKIAAAKVMFPWLNDRYKALVDARIALIQEAGDVDTKLARVPLDLSQDPGLVYDRIKWHRRKEKNTVMLKLFDEIQQPKEDEELWWRERNLLTRRLMDDHQYQDAYNLVKQHGLSKGEHFANGEWLAGWIALRLLKRPGIALTHFQTLYAKVKSPISVARAAYWSARAAAALGQKEEAKMWMSKAKAFPGTYYGQIALRGSVTGATPPLHSKRSNIDGTLRQKFEQREMVQAIRLLSAVGAKQLMEPFEIKLAQDLTDPGEQILLIELAAKEGSPYYGVLAAKKLPLKHTPLIEAAYPVLPRHYHKDLSKANPALVHAIIRQESRFKADAISPAGAQGLMQLMPKTALQTAKKTKARLGPLSDPRVNVPLGCAHLRELLIRYEGSLILAIAAYNAGAAAVDSWIQKYGDPREGEVDLIDWIEKIPFAETRNYVQRVWENYAYYAQRLGA